MILGDLFVQGPRGTDGYKGEQGARGVTVGRIKNHICGR